MTDVEKAVAKLRRPPAVQNWARQMKQRTDDTARSMFNSIIRGPKHDLRKVLGVITQIVVDGLSDDAAYKAMSLVPNPIARKAGMQILPALLPYIRERRWKGVEVFRNFIEYFHVGAGVKVPIKPTFVLNDAGILTPYFVIPWATIGLDFYQKQIISTLIRESVLTLEEFQGSDAVIICIPRHKFSKIERYVVEWRVSRIPSLKGDEKIELFERYERALGIAEKMIFEFFNEH